MIGASVYLKTFDPKYINMLQKNNVKKVFTSLHVPEDNYDFKIIEQIFKIDEMDFIIDISPATFELLQIKDYNELKKYNVKTVRLDYGFDDINLVKDLAEQFNIVLNASIVTKEYIEKLQNHDIDVTKIYAMHNFYPKMHSGLNMETLVEKNAMLHAAGVKIMAFIAGDLENRFPTFEGLITCEAHRGMDPYVAAYILKNAAHVDEIFIGDGECSEALIQKLNKLDQPLQLRVHIKKEYRHLLDTTISVRSDSNDRVLRLNTRNSEMLKQTNCKTRVRGSICVTNSLYGRYMNEIELYNVDAGFDARYNTIGYICQEDLALLSYKLKEIQFVEYQ